MIKKLHKKMLLAACFAGTMLTSNAQTGLNFDGVNDYIQTPFAGVLGSANRTFEAWIYVPSPGPSINLGILDYGINAAGSRNTFLIKDDNSLRFVSGGSFANLGTDPNTVPLDAWTHVAFVLNNGTGYLYINGVEAISGNLSNVNTPSEYEDVLIGNRVAAASTNNMFFGGQMDEVRIWDIARTGDEIQDAMYTEFCESTSGLVAYYKMNDGISGADNTGATSVNDLVAGNDGVLNNFALTDANSNFVDGVPLITLDETTLTAFQENATYQWIDCDNGGAYIDGATEQSFTSEVAGTYAVEITLDGCMTTSECMEVASLGIETSVIESLNIFPNPTADFVTISLNATNSFNVKLINITGQVIGSFNGNQSNKLMIDLQNHKSGIYFLKIELEKGQTKTFKIVKL
ncbi:LamG-like jellyroll fold domain-containing protein [Mangrovimonas futianensis]|uniref:LamG-like jellyroll fold domain-containing protein n=1 Tax=Mangrovimonas futianensis TaxID=2895523 RepID=UPI001E2BD836|nr:LamG-like jellyroll fold domain-containing protein [Mangrovimonas futianensis]MCF1423142.1 T9SS type A sorting domain-containing protein [Mangrovimonas futianensis]